MRATGRAERTPPLDIRRLSLTDFRNYAGLSLDLQPGAVVLTGENGAGKTNLLEAVSLFSPGRGLRRAPYAEMAREGADMAGKRDFHADMARERAGGGFAVHARLEGPFGECEIGTGTLASGQEEAEGGARRVRINGAPAKSTEEMLEWLRVVWLTPSMDGLFTGPAGDRRRFLDRLVLTIDPTHGRRTLDYERAMRGRNRLLSEGRMDESWLGAIELQMAETGVAIAAARGELLRLATAMIERLPDDSAFPKADLVIAGALEEQIGERPAVEIEEWLRGEFAAGRMRDRAAGRTLDGPQRADFLVRHRPKDMPAALCSTGEQKALLVGIVLAHARLTGEMAGMTPILLLDEIAAHFDQHRRAALFDILEDLGCQVFMTGTEPALFSALKGKAQFLTVSSGTASETD
ncbi:MAG: DNA replication/repair protein RecF [Hyphomicrobiales bacterium]|nr:DNA replication/repair protein RecF [Hyphomicrobiales bacterium]